MWNFGQTSLFLVCLVHYFVLTFGEVTDVNFLKLQRTVSDMQLQFQEHQIEMNKTKEDLRETRNELAETKTILETTILQVQWTLVIVNSVLSPILFTNERCSLFSM